MGRKRETRPTWRSTKSRYFPDPLSGQTLEPIRLKLGQIVSDLSASGTMNFLDTSGVNQQVVLNLLILWGKHVIDKKGAKALEKELAPVLAELEVMVSERMLADGKEIEPSYIPTGVRVPKPVKRKPSETDE